MSQSPATALAARGRTITLADGTTVPLRYTFASILWLEEQRGGDLMALMRDFETAARAYPSPDNPEPEPLPKGAPTLFVVVVEAITAGLVGQTLTHPRTGEPFVVEDDPGAVRYMLDLARLTEYSEAFGSAFGEAFGDVGGDAVPPANREARRAASRGGNGGTSRSAKAGTARSGSGA